MSDDELVSLRTFLQAIMDERDRKYDEKFRSAEVAVSAALVEKEKAVTAAFLAAEKATIKAEEAQRIYNEAHNDLIRKGEEQYRMMIPREEAVIRVEAIDDKLEALRSEIASLRESRSSAEGNKLGSRELGAYIIAIGSIGISIALHFFK